jgi:hypothetical protein
MRPVQLKPVCGTAVAVWMEHLCVWLDKKKTGQHFCTIVEWTGCLASTDRTTVQLEDGTTGLEGQWGSLLLDFKLYNNTISAHCWCQTLQKLCTKIKNKTQGKLTDSIILLQDNAHCDVVHGVHDQLNVTGWDAFKHPTHRPDLLPYTIQIFGSKPTKTVCSHWMATCRRLWYRGLGSIPWNSVQMKCAELLCLWWFFITVAIPLPSCTFRFQFNMPHIVFCVKLTIHTTEIQESGLTNVHTVLTW